MELDLSEYDQVDEIKLIRESYNPLCNVGVASSKFIATLSSCSDQASFEEANYENDFVFLPAASEQTVVGRTQQENQQQQQRQVVSPPSGSQLDHLSMRDLNPPHQQVASGGTRPFMATQIENIANNPFGNLLQPVASDGGPHQHQHAIRLLKGDTCASKPAGLLEVCPSTASNPNKLADLMQQIVTRSELILITIPCAYCHEQIACSPLDISSWLNHMSDQHNCRICPICNKMIGLGPRKAIEIMKRHVLDHIDNDWLEKRAVKVNFSFGLQQQWFSGNRCSVKNS